jgi:hypothetical protein
VTVGDVDGVDTCPVQCRGHASDVHRVDAVADGVHARAGDVLGEDPGHRTTSRFSRRAASDFKWPAIFGMTESRIKDFDQ